MTHHTAEHRSPHVNECIDNYTNNSNGKMSMSIRKWVFAVGSAIVMTVAGCAAADKTASGPKPSARTTSAPMATPATTAADAQPLDGWYMQGASGNRLQACGQSEQWPIGDKADLEARAKAFDLQDDTPVYVKLLARVTGSGNARQVDVVKVEQFGSPTPVRDCGMTGVVTPAPGA